MLKPYLEKALEVGCDEAGRGPLAGPVVAAAVVLPTDFAHPLLDDSKKMPPKHRFLLEEVIQQEALAIGIAEATVAEIDALNILQATFLAMHRALAQIVAQGIQPSLLLIDGNRFKPFEGLPHRCLVGGDGQLASIAAASVLAKNRRDRYMHALATSYPGYGWETNVGYPTRAHRTAIAHKGLTPHHRKSFSEKFCTPSS